MEKKCETAFTQEPRCLRTVSCLIWLVANCSEQRALRSNSFGKCSFTTEAPSNRGESKVFPSVISCRVVWRAGRSAVNNDSKMSLSGLVNGIQLCIAYAFAAQVEMDGGCDDQRQHHGDEDAADDGNGEWLKHLGPRADGESQRQHAGHC